MTSSSNPPEAEHAAAVDAKLKELRALSEQQIDPARRAATALAHDEIAHELRYTIDVAALRGKTPSRMVFMCLTEALETSLKMAIGADDALGGQLWDASRAVAFAHLHSLLDAKRGSGDRGGQNASQRIRDLALRYPAKAAADIGRLAALELGREADPSTVRRLVREVRKLHQ